MQITARQLYRGILKLVPLFLVLVFAFGIIGYSPVQADPGWYNTSWLYRKQIEIHSSNVTADLTDFPVLISITSDGDIGSHAQTDGDDIIFTRSDEVTEIPYEIESFSSDGSTANLTIWVKVPNLSSSSNTDIYMYYGNNNITSPLEDPTNAWDNNFKMVQHLEETTGGSEMITDSTANSNNGTDTNGPALGTAGKINGATTFASGNDYIGVDDSASLDISSNITLEAWIYTTTLDGTHRRIIIKPLSTWNMPYYEYSWWVYGTGTENLGFGISDGTTRVYSTNGTLTASTWQHVAGTYDGTTLRWYINGDYITQMSTGAVSSIGTNNEPVSIGSVLPLQPNLEFVGTIDEVRISSTDRDADWLKTGYNNQSNPSSFYTLHGEEGAPPVVVTNAASNVEETTATLNGNITAIGVGNADTRGFEWDTDSGVPYSSNWTEGGSFGTGAFPHGLSGLTRGELYYYRAMAHNSAGWGYGSEQAFLTKPDGPTALTAVSHGTDWIYLTWTSGTGSDNTTVQYLAGAGYPGSPTAGTTGYSGPGTSANITGLSDNQTYSFRAWSYATEGGLEQWSDGYSSASDTTDAIGGGPPPTVIGGKVLIVNKAALLAPWVALAAVLSIIAIKVVRYFRKKVQLRSLSKKTD